MPYYKLAIWILAVLVTFLAVLPLVAALLQPGRDVYDEIVEDFNAGHVGRPKQLLVVEGFRSGDQGWYLPPGTSGRLVYQAIGHEGRRIGLHLWMYSPPSVRTKVVATSAGHASAVLSTDATYSGGELALPGEIATAPSIDIEFRAQNTTAAEVLVIDELVTDTYRGSQPVAPPSLTYLAVGVLAGFLTFPFVRQRKRAVVIAIGVGLVTATATAMRMSALFAQQAALDPDAVGYRLYADRFEWWPFASSGLFSGNFSEREPLFPLVVHAYFQLIGSSDFHIRVVSSTLSIAVVLLAVVAAKRLLVTWPARLAVGMTLAVSGPLVAESARGLRLELEMILILLLYLALDRAPARNPLVDSLLIGLLGAALVLTRTYFLPLFTAAVTVSFLCRYRLRPQTLGLVALAIVIMLSAAAAHRLGLYQVQHDAFWDTAGYARWNANVERFAYHRPLPHPELFPTAAQYQNLGPYFGPHISALQYFLVIHSPLEFVRDSLAGLRQIFDTIDGFVPQLNGIGSLTSRLGPRVDFAARWLSLLGLIGLVTRAWRHPRYLLIPVIVASALASEAFLFNHGLLERYRHTWQTIPLVLIAGAWLVEGAVLIAIRRFGYRWKAALGYRRFANIELVLFPIAVLLALAQSVLSPSLLAMAAVLLAASIGALVYRRPGVGAAALVLAVSVTGARTGAVAGAISAIAILARQRPAIRSLLPIALLLPFGLAVAVAGRPGSTALLFVAEMLTLTVVVAVASSDRDSRDQLLWMVAVMGPLAGIAYVLEPAASPTRMLAPAAAVAAMWLYLTGSRWALWLGLLDLTIVVLTDPLFSWIGVLAAVIWLILDSGMLSEARWRVAIGAGAPGLALAAGVASLASTTPPLESGWRSYIGDTNTSIRQQINVDSAGYDSLWIYGRRASTFTDFPVRLDVNGASLTSDLNADLPTELMAWVREPLPSAPRPGDVLDITITATGTPDLANRYIEIGGVYAHAVGITSTYWNGSAELQSDLSPDTGTQAGTYLIVLGDESLPHAPSVLPLPLVQGQWKPPMGQCLPGECDGPIATREQADTAQIWRDSLRAALQNPLRGLGYGQLASALNTGGMGLGPGLSARNEYLQAAADWGLPGLFGLLVILGGAVAIAWGRRDRLAIALMVLTVVSMVGESLLLDRAGAAATWMVIGLCLASTSGRNLVSGWPAKGQPES